jgi:catechol 2,3-dioxygenase-like lactoylglutathione lyase family enzyme
MPDFRVLSFNHTAFTVSDLDRIIPFFCDLLGFELTSRAPRDGRLIGRMTAIEGVEIEIAYVKGTGHRIELIQYKAPAGRAERHGHRGPGRRVGGVWLRTGRRDHRDRRRPEQRQPGRLPARPRRHHRGIHPTGRMTDEPAAPISVTCASSHWLARKRLQDHLWGVAATWRPAPR